MFFRFVIRIASYRQLLVQRHLTNTVDGVLRLVVRINHTVLGTLEHHARTIDTAEVGTLDSVQQTTGIDRAETKFLPICFTFIGIRQMIILFFADPVIQMILMTIDVYIPLAQVFQLEVGSLAVGQLLVF